MRTGNDGRASFLTRPGPTRARRAGRLDWVEGATSDVHRVDNLPPGEPVVLPDEAPRPRITLPAQPHAVGAGPNADVTRIPDRVWRQMTGATWRAGCPVGRDQLRYARINYWDYRGYRRRGEFVAHADAVPNVVAAFAEMYTQGLPLRSLYRVDRFGYSSRLRGGDDFASMAAGNTSVFNCRDVVNRPRSAPRTRTAGRSTSTPGRTPTLGRGNRAQHLVAVASHPRVAWRSASHRVVEIMGRNGLRWTYGLGDTQHFDARAGNGRYAVIPRSAAASAVTADCIFCGIAARKVAADRVLEEDDFVGFLDQRPVFKGHVLLVPRTHVVTLPDLPAGARRLRRGRPADRERGGRGPRRQGSFVAVNNVVSQSVPHLHLHVVPRTKGDGLRNGFFWPRTRYAGPEERAEYAARLRSALGWLLP